MGKLGERLFKILQQVLEIIIIFIKVQNKTEKYQKPPKTDVTMTKKAKVTSLFFDLQFCLTMLLRGCVKSKH